MVPSCDPLELATTNVRDAAASATTLTVDAPSTGTLTDL